MMYKNPESNRINAFKHIYDCPDYTSASKESIPNKPLLTDVELTNDCNLSCKMCVRRIMKRKIGYMTDKTFDKILRDCKDIPMRFIRWGEPFLHPHIIEYCKKIKRHDIPLHITSNGLAITEKHMKSLVKLGVDSIIFSMQGATKEEYGRMRCNSEYDRLKSNIMKLIDLRGIRYKPYIHVSTTILDDTKEEVDDFANYWSHIVDSVGIGRTNMARITGKKSENARYKSCREIYRKLSIDWNGDVTACCADYNNLLVLDNIHNHNLLDIWNENPRLVAIRTLLDDGLHRSLTLCKDCYSAYEDFV